MEKERRTQGSTRGCIYPLIKLSIRVIDIYKKKVHFHFRASLWKFVK